MVGRGDFSYPFFFFPDSLFLFLPPIPSLCLYFITLLPSLGEGLSISAHQAFFYSFLFSSLAYIALFCLILCVDGEHGEDKAICFSIVAIKKGAHIF
jgi:hypothetical protein